MTKKGTENMSAQVSMNDLDVRIVKPSNIKSEVNYAFNRIDLYLAFARVTCI